jgi:hypothetical protein
MLMAQSETCLPVTVAFRHDASCLPLAARTDSRREH